MRARLVSILGAISLVAALTAGGAAADMDRPVPAGGTVGLEQVADGFTAPVWAGEPDDGSGRLFVVDQVGLVRIIGPDGTSLDEPFLDVRDRLVTLRPGFDERGLLGLAFHPDFADNGTFYVYYSAPLQPGGPEGWDHTSHISEFQVSPADPDQADPDSERILLQVDQPQFNHNAGDLAFGPDGFLYIALGDGGGANDVGVGHTEELGNGQDPTNLLGSILRIDVDGEEPYQIPDDNPFIGTIARDETFAYGFRNPYRFTFDPAGEHGLLAADAGQALWEEVSIVEAGGNYGWNIKEGTHCFDPQNMGQPPAACPDTGPRGEPLIDPVIEYPNTGPREGVDFVAIHGHDEHIGTSVIGGHVYRGNAIPELQGKFVFGDWTANRDMAAGALFVAAPSDPHGVHAGCRGVTLAVETVGAVFAAATTSAPRGTARGPPPTTSTPSSTPRHSTGEPVASEAWYGPTRTRSNARPSEATTTSQPPSAGNDGLPKVAVPVAPYTSGSPSPSRPAEPISHRASAVPEEVLQEIVASGSSVPGGGTSSSSMTSSSRCTARPGPSSSSSSRRSTDSAPSSTIR
jgi:glucose/arabinose dehydrogenase